MISPLDVTTIGSIVSAIALLILHYRLAIKFGTGFFTCSLISATVIAVAAAAIALAPAEPAAMAAADVGIALAGALAFTAAVWLLLAFNTADDADEP